MEKENKVLFALMLAVFAIVACAFITFDDEDVSATDGVWSSGSVTSLSGDGTESNPYKIGTANELAFLAEKINAGEAEYVGKHYVLVSDINLAGKEWVPIGTEGMPFKGVFDGRGKIISGITINCSSTTTKEFKGLFGVTDGMRNEKFNGLSDILVGDNIQYDVLNNYATIIKNVKLTGININVEDQGCITGALIGNARNTLVDNVVIESGKFNAVKNSGGIAGYLNGSVIYRSSTDSVQITTGDGGIYSVAGIAGCVRSGSNAIVNTVNNANVDATVDSAAVAGILGNTIDEQFTLIFNSTNNGNISIDLTRDASNVYEKSATGILGHMNPSQNVAIVDCINTGVIKNKSSHEAGSLAGIANYAGGTIRGCINTGTIEGNAKIISGIVSCNSSSLVFTDCKNDGGLEGNGDYKANIIAYVRGGEITYKDTIIDSEAALTELLPSRVDASHLTFFGVVCPKDSILELGGILNPGATVPNDKGEYPEGGAVCRITVDHSLNGASIVIGKAANVVLYVEDSDVKVNFNGTIYGSAYVECNGSNDIYLENTTNINRLKLELSNSKINVNGNIVESISFIGNCNEIIWGNATVEKYGVAVNGYGNVFINNGVVNNINHYLDISGDNNVLVNNGTIDTSLKVSGTNNTIRNNVGHNISKVSVVGKVTIVNEGSLGNIESGHVVSVGVSKGECYVNTSLELHNYGEIIGPTNNGNYIVYTAGFEKIVWYNHDGSKVEQRDNGNLFRFDPTEYGEPKDLRIRGLGVIEFLYSYGTVMKNDEPITITENNLGIEVKTAPVVGFVKDLTLDVNGGIPLTVERSKIAVVKDTKMMLPTPVRNGYEFKGWFDAKGTLYDGSITVAKLDDVPETLVAKWDSKESQTISSDGNTYVASEELVIGNDGIDFKLNGGAYTITLRDVTLVPGAIISVEKISDSRKTVSYEINTPGSVGFTATLPCYAGFDGVRVACDGVPLDASYIMYSASEGIVSFYIEHNSVFTITGYMDPVPSVDKIVTNDNTNGNTTFIIGIVVLVAAIITLATVIRRK